MGMKRERKRQKKQTPEKPLVNRSLDDVDNVLSPSFPLFNFSPHGSFANDIEDFRNVISGGDEITPLPLRGDHDNLGEGTLAKDMTVPMVTPTGERLSEDGIIFTNLTMPAAASQSNSTPHDGSMPSTSLADNITSKKLDFSEVKEEGNVVSPPENKSNAKDGIVGAEGEDNTLRTPKRKLITDLESASSPATDGKDTAPRAWSHLRGTLLRKEEQTEVCRLPRILRVKIGSGRSLRKFEM